MASSLADQELLAEAAPDQIKASDALTALKPLLESTGILKIGFNIKFNAVMLAQHGITLRNVDDAQLMSYALDAGRNSHALESLAERWFDQLSSGVPAVMPSPSRSPMMCPFHVTTKAAVIAPADSKTSRSVTRVQTGESAIIRLVATPT